MQEIWYLPWSLCNHMGFHPLQDCKERRCQEHRDLAGFVQVSTQDLHPLYLFCSCKSLANHSHFTQNAAALQILNKSNGNSMKKRNNGTSIDSKFTLHCGWWLFIVSMSLLSPLVVLVILQILCNSLTNLFDTLLLLTHGLLLFKLLYGLCR
jgi:hypothetical protein